MGKEEIKKAYVHYFKPVQASSYPEGYQHILVTDDIFDSVISKIKLADEVSADFETTSLNVAEAEVVGLGICIEPSVGYYFPFGHVAGKEFNLSSGKKKELLDLLFVSSTLWYNVLYDVHLMAELGYDIDEMNYFDVMILVWLLDTNWQQIGLKWSASFFLGWNMTKFEELVGNVKNIAWLYPKDVLSYVCSDALATFNLKKHLLPLLEKEAAFVLKLDNRILKAVIRAHQENQLLDVDILKKVGVELNEEIPKLEKEIWALANRVFDINSPAQVAAVLTSLGLDTGGRTKKDQMTTGKDALSRIDHPIGEKISLYKQYSKWKSSFVGALLKAVDSGRPVHFKYFTASVPTARFSSGEDKNNSYYAPINIQAVLKPKSVKKYAHYIGNDQGILGWVFNDDTSGKEIEVYSEVMNVRRAFKAPEDYWYVRVDYSGEELRLAANISGEPVWIKAFLNGEDIHAAVAKEVFGDVNKELRAQAKIVNFGTLYGATPYSHARKFNISLEEATDFFLRYKSKHRVLFNWCDSITRQTSRSGVVFTAFGRPRRLFHYFASSDPKTRAFAKRSTVNNCIQGSAADVFRIGYLRMYEKVFKPYKDICKFRQVVHDEIDFILRKDSLYLLDEIVSILTLKRKDWKVPMEVSVDLGTSWGDLVGFHKVNGTWEPDFKE